ncbi:MAG: AzlC family ABC transporter permease [Alicyclobacillus sp.]|nr:AzlC family ABC transporter permease [Alicyclobacillus sp.]
MRLRGASVSSLARAALGQKGFVQALADTFPLSLSVFTYGTAYGALAHSSNHLGLAQTLAMSAVVFAGASQFTILALLHDGAAVWAVVGGTFLINARQMLYGLTLGPALKQIPTRHLAWLAHGLTDETYSVTTVAADTGPLGIGYVAGAGAAIFGPWLLSSGLGFALGGLLGDPTRLGLDFAYVGAFLGLLMAQLQRPRQVFAALSAAAIAIAVYHFLGTTGAVLAGALAAFALGVTER